MARTSESSGRNDGIIVDDLHVALTRPAMFLGATYNAFVLNGMLTMIVFVSTRNIFYLGLGVPIHLFCFAVCQHDACAFDIFFLWLRTKAASLIFGNGRHWAASSYSPSPISIGKRLKG